MGGNYPGTALEGQTPAYLNDALRSRSRGDLGIVARPEVCGGVRETHQVEDIGRCV